MCSAFICVLSYVICVLASVCSDMSEFMCYHMSVPVCSHLCVIIIIIIIINIINTIIITTKTTTTTSLVSSCPPTLFGVFCQDFFLRINSASADAETRKPIIPRDWKHAKLLPMGERERERKGERFNSLEFDHFVELGTV